jgi:MFS family permease
VLLGLLALLWRSRFSAIWSRGPNRAVDLTQALNVWIIQLIVAIGPPLGGLVLMVYMKTDWGISLFFLVPLALVAIPRLRVPGLALFRIVVIWFVLSLATLLAAPTIAEREMAANPNAANSYAARSQLARELTQAWRMRFGSRWAVVAGTTEIGESMTFYSPDHPAPLTPGEVWSSGLTSLEEAKRLGFIGICDTTDNRLPECEAWMKDNAPNAEQLVMTTQRFFQSHPGPSVAWKVYIQPPGK